MIWKTNDMPETGIVEAKNIIRAIQQKYGYDFTQFAQTAFRFAIDRSLKIHHLKFPELLASRILEDDEFFDEFLFELGDTGIELFRDTETWNLLKSDILPRFFENFKHQKIWFPLESNGQDFFSLLILLKSAFPTKKVSIDITALSEKTLHKLSTGEIPSKQLESGLQNFEKVIPEKDINSFLGNSGKEIICQCSTSQTLTFWKQNLHFEPVHEKPGMIFFRNKLLPYNQEGKFNVLDKLVAILEPGGYLITGINENIDDFILKQQNLVHIDKKEKVYKKR
jgi:chemotaxis protein methyltransferase CheR